MKSSLLTVLFCILLLSCSKKPKTDEFKVEGFLRNGANRSLIISELTPEGPLVIDSVKLDKNGEFEFVYKMPYKSFYRLETDNQEFITFVPDYKEVVSVEAHYDSVSLSYTVNGSAESKLLWDLNKKELEGIYILNSIIEQWENKDGITDSIQLKARLDSLYYQTLFDQENYYYDFIHDHKGSLTMLMALYKKFNGKDLFSITEHVDLYNTVLEGMEKKLPDNPHTKHFIHSYHRKSVYP